MSDTITAALVAAWAGIVAALVNWLMNLKLRQRGELQEIELARLKSDLALSEERLRGTIAQDLARHESGLREAAEFRLKLYSAAIDSIDKTSRAVGAIVDHFARLASGELTERDMATFMDPLSAGMLLPPSLDVALTEVLDAAGEMAVAFTRSRDLEKEARKEAIEDSMTKHLAPALEKFTMAARAWKTSVWSQEAAK